MTAGLFIQTLEETETRDWSVRTSNANANAKNRPQLPLSDASSRVCRHQVRLQLKHFQFVHRSRKNAFASNSSINITLGALDSSKMDISTDSRRPPPTDGEGELSPLEQEVLNEYAKLVGNLDDVCHSLTPT